MNKRIESLRKEAGLTPYYEDQSGQIQKFAELIVRECSEVIDPLRAEIDALQAKIRALESQEPVAEIIECSVMGQQTVQEIDGRWKFLKIGDKLYSATGAVQKVQK